MNMQNMNDIVGQHNIVFITLDTLRYDVAVEAYSKGLIPNFASVMKSKWQLCHTPGTFTYAAHQAFFAGFLPTPAIPGKHERLFAARFAGSETSTQNTCEFDSADIISGFSNVGYRTICIGGVGFFNKRTPLGNVLPGFFAESYWQQEFGVTHPASTENQFHFAKRLLITTTQQKFFLFINVSAIHQPNKFYLPGATQDSLESHSAALQYVDKQLPILFEALRTNGDTFCIICSDHGTAYGEDGYYGHRIAHPTVLHVPFTTFILKGNDIN